MKKSIDFYDNFFICDDVKISLNDFSEYLKDHLVKETSEKYNMSCYKVRQIIEHYKLEKSSSTAVSLKYFDTYVMRGFQKIYLKDIEDYYLKKNNSRKDTALKFDVSLSCISSIIKHYKLKKSSESIHELRDKTCLEKYNDVNICVTKARKSNLKKYGYENPFQFCSKEIHDTLKNKYGGSGFASNSIATKIHNTCKDRYGYEYYQSSPDFKEKIKQTSLKRYGVSHPMKVKEIRDSCITEKSIKKIFETKLKNGTTNTSKPENDLYKFLCENYNNYTILRNYNKDERYPFHCDFYIKEKDLFIELNLFFTHGKHPFNKGNENDIKVLNKWKEKAKTSKFMENAIKIWTESDVKKQEYAKKNKLNYITIYSYNELNKFKEKVLNEIK